MPASKRSTGGRGSGSGNRRTARKSGASKSRTSASKSRTGASKSTASKSRASATKSRASASKSRASSSRASSSRSSSSASQGKSRGGRTGAKSTAEEAVQRIRELNDRIVENARNAGGNYLDIYERTLKTIVGYQEELAKSTPIDWVQRVLEAQATFTREVGNFYASHAREALKKK